jgi:hypothetical protein
MRLTYPTQVQIQIAEGRGSYSTPTYGVAFNAWCRVSSRMREIAIGGEMGRERIDTHVFIFPAGSEPMTFLGDDLIEYVMEDESLISWRGRMHKVARIEEEFNENTGEAYALRVYARDAGKAADGE